MAFISRVSSTFLKIQEISVKIPSTYVQLRWRTRDPKRKPKWLPRAPSKLYTLNEHPYVSPEEQQLKLDLLEEYFLKIESLRVMFKDELAQKNKDEGKTLENEKLEEARFRLLLEENQKENDRMKVIREEAMEKLFQEQHLHFLQLEEERKLKEQQIKAKVDELVRKEKEREFLYITHANLDAAVEKALDNPKNLNFAIDVNGNVKFEGNPPPDYEEEIKGRIAQSTES